MKLTTEQFKALQPYEEFVITMLRSEWTRHPGDSALDLMAAIYSKVSGSKVNLNKGCSSCIMNLIKDIGSIYMTDKKEMDNSVAVEVVESEKVPVKNILKIWKKQSKSRENGDKKN